MDKGQQIFQNTRSIYRDLWYFYILVKNNLKMKLKTVFK